MPLPDIQDALEQLRQGQPAEAIPPLERLTEALPLYATAHALLAEAYEKEQRWPEALASWQRARFLAPSSPAVQAGLRRAIAARSPVPILVAPEAAPPEVAPLEAPQASPEPEPAEAPAALQQTSAPKARRRKKSRTDKATGRAKDQVGLRNGDAPIVPEAPAPLQESEPVPGRTSNLNDLDRLIEELEAVRIVPRPDLESVPTPDLDDEIEDMVSETLARIYASQKQYDEAARIYELLAAQHPEASAEFLQKATQMRDRASDE